MLILSNFFTILLLCVSFLGPNKHREHPVDSVVGDIPFWESQVPRRILMTLLAVGPPILTCLIAEVEGFKRTQFFIFYLWLLKFWRFTFFSTKIWMLIHWLELLEDMQEQLWCSLFQLVWFTVPEGNDHFEGLRYRTTLPPLFGLDTYVNFLFFKLWSDWLLRSIGVEERKSAVLSQIQISPTR